MKNKPRDLPAKDRLLQAAIGIFGLYGYEGASTRQLTKEARVNISAIPYYFGDKEGLYQAALMAIAEKIRGELGIKAAAIREKLKSETLGEKDCRVLVHDMLSTVIRFLLSRELSPAMARIFMREQMEPTPAFTAFYENSMRPMHETLTALVARATGLPFPSEKATLCAHTLLGSITIFKTHREAALRRLAWKKYGNKEIEKITDIVLRHADAIIDLYRREKRRPS